MATNPVVSSGITDDSTLTTLASALSTASKMQMRRIKFALETSRIDSPSDSIEELLNLYAEKAPTQSPSSSIVKSLPGWESQYTIGTGPIRVINNDLPNVYYVVSGTHLWRIGGAVITDMGDIGVPSGFSTPMVTVAVGPVNGVVCCPPRAWTFGTTELVMHELTGTFPGASSVTYLDGYFVFTGAGSTPGDISAGRFFWSDLLNPTSYSAFAFAHADGVPNVVRRVLNHQGELWFFGEGGIEVWYDTGEAIVDNTTGSASGLPFARRAGGVIRHGALSPRSIAIGDNKLFWIGADHVVYQSNGYAAERISTHSIEQAMLFYDPDATTSDKVLCAFCHEYAGHWFYVFTLQGSQPGLTFAYDVATGLWHRRSTTTDGNGPWNIRCAANTPKGLYGDATTNFIWGLSPAVGTEGSVAPLRRATSPPLWGSTRRATMHRLEIEAEPGLAALTLDYSDDLGVTWKGTRVRPMTGRRAFAARLGDFRRRTLRISATGVVRILAVDAEIESHSA